MGNPQIQQRRPKMLPLNIYLLSDPFYQMHTLVLVLCLAVTVCSFGQELVPYRLDKKWGYSDPSGKIVVTPAYDKTEFFQNNGFALVTLDTLQTLIDKSGKRMMPFKYSTIFPFESGMAAVCIGGHHDAIQGEIVGGTWGFINDKFEEVIPPKYTRAQSFRGNYAIVQSSSNWGPWGVIDKTGKVVVPIRHKTYMFDMRPLPGLAWSEKPGQLRTDVSGKGERWQIMDLAMNPIGAPYNAMHGERQTNYVGNQVRKPISVLDKEGKQLVLDGNSTIQKLTGTTSLVAGASEDGGLHYAIISGNKTIVPADRYDNIADECREGMVKVIGDYLLAGFIDCTTGKEIIPPKYSYIDNFRDGFAYVWYNYTSNNYKGDGWIDRDGKEFFFDTPTLHVIATKKYDALSQTNKDKIVLRDEHNKAVEAPWLGYYGFTKQKGPYLFFESSGKVGVAKIEGTSIQNHVNWEEYCCQAEAPFSSGLDTTGTHLRKILDPGVAYDSSYLLDNVDTLVMVTKGGKKGIVRIDGTEIVPPAYFEVTPFLTATGYHFLVYNKDQKSGVLNSRGQQVLPLQYDHVNVESPRYQSVSISEFDRFGMLKDGDKLIIPVKYSQIDVYEDLNEKNEPVNTAFLVYEDERPFIVDSEGQTVFKEPGASLEYLGEGSGIYFTVYTKKKTGIFRVGTGLVVPTIYNYVEPMVGDGIYYFTVKQGRKYGVIDGAGKIIVPVKYKSVFVSDAGDGLFDMTDDKNKTFRLTKDYKIVEQKDNQ
jgi:hypothetical protein